MKHLVQLVVLGSIATVAYLYITAEVPGGEKRYEQVFRQFKDQHMADLPFNK